jgi:hypothetical protein
MAGIANFDYDTQNADIQRRQAMADALMTGSLSSNGFTTPHGGRLSPLSAIAPIVEAYMAKRMQGKISQDRTDLTNRYKADLQQGVQDYMDKSNGAVREVPNQGPPNPDGTPLGSMQEVVQPDRKAAILGALASNHPALQALGQSGLASMNKSDPFMAFLQSQGGGPQPGSADQTGAQPRQIDLNYGAAPTGGGGGTGAGDVISRVAPHLDRTVAMGLLASDPSGQKLMQAEAEAAKPVIGRGDGIYDVRPGAATLKPGYVSGVGAVEGAKAGVKDEHTLVDGKLPDGTPVVRTQKQALETAGGIAPQPGQAAPATVGAPGQPPGGGFVNGQSPAVETEVKEYGGHLAKEHQAMNEEATNSQLINARIGEMAQASQGFTAGSLQPYKGALGGLLIAVGQDPQKVDAKLGNISDWQAFNKEATQMAFDLTRTLGSREAASVVSMAVKNSANDSLQPAANRKILGVMSGIADWKQARARSADAWAQGHGGSIQGFQTFWNDQAPIGPYIEAATNRLPAPKGLPTQPATRPKVRFEDLP